MIGEERRKVFDRWEFLRDWTSGTMSMNKRELSDVARRRYASGEVVWGGTIVVRREVAEVVLEFPVRVVAGSEDRGEGKGDQLEEEEKRSAASD